MAQLRLPVGGAAGGVIKPLSKNRPMMAIIWKPFRAMSMAIRIAESDEHTEPSFSNYGDGWDQFETAASRGHIATDDERNRAAAAAAAAVMAQQLSDSLLPPNNREPTDDAKMALLMTLQAFADAKRKLRNTSAPPPAQASRGTRPPYHYMDDSELAMDRLALLPDPASRPADDSVVKMKEHEVAPALSAGTPPMQLNQRAEWDHVGL